MKQIQKLILLEIGKAKTFEDGGKTFKHSFLTEDGKEAIMFCPNDSYKDCVTPALSWDEKKAHNYLVEIRAPWNGVEKLPKLIEKEIALPYLKSAGVTF